MLGAAQHEVPGVPTALSPWIPHDRAVTPYPQTTLLGASGAGAAGREGIRSTLEGNMGSHAGLHRV